jgi:hypothetical protein
LLAVAERRLAFVEIDLKQSQDCLADAISRDDNPGVTDCRFDSEGLAITVARLNFSVFGPPSPATGVVGAELIYLVVQTLEVAQREAASIFDKLAKENLAPAAEWVEQQTTTNVLNVVLVAAHLKCAIPDSISDLTESCLTRAQKGHAQRRRDDVAYFIFLVAAIDYAKPSDQIADLLLDLDRLTFPVYTPFDKPREAAFRTLVAHAREAE